MTSGCCSSTSPCATCWAPGLDRKRASSVLRNPDVLWAIAEAREGRSADVPFSLPVPIERHFQAYAARISATPPATALLLHDLTVVRKSEQMRADFIANASHELRTPLAAVSGFIETLRGHAKDDEAARDQFLDIMAVEAARMRRLIDDLLSLTRIEMNEHVPPQGRVALDGRGAPGRQRAGAAGGAGRHHASTVEAAPGLPPVIGEHDELVQLFQNLVHNAIKYGREDGQVQVTLGAGAGRPGLRRGEGRRRGHRPQRHSPPDRAILPGGREAQPRTGRHGAGPGHRQAHRQPPPGPAVDRKQAGRRQHIYRVSAGRARRKIQPKPRLPEPVTEML